jgi:hypothetical protein
MSSIQEKATASILSVIRARRKSASALPSDVPLPSPGVLPRAAIREASFSDFSAVAALKQRGGLVADSFENWERLWRHNPALTESQNNRPIGWVLEADGAVVGYLGNISLLCRFGDRTLTAATSHGLVVDPPYRSLGLTLIAAFFRQKSVDLFLSTSAIESVGKIAIAFKSSSVPQPDYDTVLFWVLRPRPFARALMKKLQLKPAVSGIAEILASIAVGTDKILRKRRPKRSSALFAMSEITITEISDDFQALWMEKANETPRVLADRSPATLRWHYEIPGDRGSLRVLCCHKNGELVGYAMVRSDTDEMSGLRKSMIADLVARQDDPEIVRALCVAAHDYAKSAGSHVLEVTGFPSSIRAVCSQGNPYSRKLPACPFFYKAADPILHKTLSDPGAWYACPFDGDATLIRPSYSDSVPPPTAKLQTRDTTGNIMSGVFVREHTEVR